VVMQVLVEQGYDHRIVFIYYRDRRGRKSIFSSISGVGSSWIILWVVALLSARSFATFPHKVAWFTAVEAFILLLTVRVFFFCKLGLETLFFGASEIY
jgi:hypothetical protein